MPPLQACDPCLRSMPALQVQAAFPLNLEFAFPGGAYPFHRADLSVAALDRLASLFPDYRLIPMAIVDAREIDAPFTLRIASHCTDDLSHGLTPGNREGWFDWPE